MIALITFLSGGIPKHTLEDTMIKFASIKSMDMNKSETNKHLC